jgi:hypothetical protein
LVCRGLVEMPDAVGESLGWLHVIVEEDAPGRRSASHASDHTPESSVGGEQ